MRNKILFFHGWLQLPLILLLLSPGSEKKEFEEAMSLYQKHQYVKASSALRSFVVKYPKSTHRPKALYTLGRLTSKPERAVNIYREVVNQYPQSDVADDALFIMGQYYEAKGKLSKAKEVFEAILVKYPESDHTKQSRKWLALTSPISVVTKGREQGDKKGARLVEETGYAVQVGSFESVPDAHRLRERLIQKGYRAYIVHALIEGKTFHRVRIGPYPNREEAHRSGEVLKEKEDLPAWVVKNE